MCHQCLHLLAGLLKVLLHLHHVLIALLGQALVHLQLVRLSLVRKTYEWM